MTTRLLLMEARDYLGVGEDRWCQCAMAVDEYGDEVDPHDPVAHGFCAVGILMNLADKKYGTPTKQDAVTSLTKVITDLSFDVETNVNIVSQYNDENDYEDIITVFDQAIAAEDDL